LAPALRRSHRRKQNAGRGDDRDNRGFELHGVILSGNARTLLYGRNSDLFWRDYFIDRARELVHYLVQLRLADDVRRGEHHMVAGHSVERTTRGMHPLIL